MNNNAKMSSYGQLDLSRFIVLLTKCVNDSKDYYPESYYYQDIKENEYRFVNFIDQIKLINITRKFDYERVNILYETYIDLIDNAVKHKNEELYFEVIYSMFDNLISRLLEVSKSEFFDSQLESTMPNGDIIKNSSPNVFKTNTPQQEGCFFYLFVLE